MSEVQDKSYGQIFKSTAFTGGASVITIFLGMVRTKAMAVLLGPSGVGLLGLYMTITALASTVAGMGISTSGVRQIADAAASGNDLQIARTTCALRRTALALGLVGALLLAALSYPTSRLTFGNGAHVTAISALGLVVLFGVISGGQTALIQGLRHIADLARLNALGAVAGTVLGLPLIWWLHERGIVALLIVVPFSSLVLSWWFARRISVTPVRLTWRETTTEARALLGLGLAFMTAGLMSAGAAYLTRSLIVRQLGVEEAGYYSAAYTLAGIYAGFILQAMGTDFYPRLTAVADDNPTINRLVNEQTEIALLLAVPGILVTLLFAPWVIRVFYAGGFEPAVGVLQWQVLGVLGRVVSWPMGFILLAKSQRAAFLLTEVAANVVHVCLVSFMLKEFNVKGTGMAYAGLYLFHTFLMIVVSRRITDFRWSPINLRMLAWMLPLVLTVFASVQWTRTPWSLFAGVAATVIASWICLSGLLCRMPACRIRRVTQTSAPPRPSYFES